MRSNISLKIYINSSLSIEIHPLTIYVMPDYQDIGKNISWLFITVNW